MRAASFGSSVTREQPRPTFGQQQVVGDAELADQGEVLVHHGNAEGRRHTGRGQPHRLAGERNLPSSGGYSPARSEAACSCLPVSPTTACISPAADLQAGAVGATTPGSA